MYPQPVQSQAKNEKQTEPNRGDRTQRTDAAQIPNRNRDRPHRDTATDTATERHRDTAKEADTGTEAQRHTEAGTENRRH